MNFIKSNLRNRLICDTVDAILAVRYGLRFVDLTPAEFVAPKSMLKLFTSDIYDGTDRDADEENNELVFQDVYDALNAVEGNL